MTEQVQQWICIKFCVKLEHYSMETIQMTQKAAAVGNWWWEASSWQHAAHASCLMQSFLVKHPIIQMTQPLHSPDLVPCDFWLFPKLKSPLKGKRFQTVNVIKQNTMWQLMASGRTVWGPKVPILKGTEMSLSYVQYFLYLLSSSINIPIFHITWMNTFWTDPVCYLTVKI